MVYIYGYRPTYTVKEYVVTRMLRCTCERCGYTWMCKDESEAPIQCRNRRCRSPYWDKPVSREHVSDVAKAVRAGTYIKENT